MFVETVVDIPSARKLVDEAISKRLSGISDTTKFIRENFSSLVSDLQVDAYELYLEFEKLAGGKVLRKTFESQLGNSDDVETLLSNIESSFYLLDRYFLSMTQGRRPRAGASFQVAMSALLGRLGYVFEEQPKFTDSKPDYIIPNKKYYDQNASDCIILSLKRTLRERWRQVPTEGNTGSTYFLATIDAQVKKDELDKMKALNVKLVVPKLTKNSEYPNALNVISFEDFLEDYLDPAMKKWRKAGVI